MVVLLVPREHILTRELRVVRRVTLVIGVLVARESLARPEQLRLPVHPQAGLAPDLVAETKILKLFD